jgi:hypothetical protein
MEGTNIVHRMQIKWVSEYLDFRNIVECRIYENYNIWLHNVLDCRRVTLNLGFVINCRIDRTKTFDSKNIKNCMLDVYQNI